jgi:signal transduction histidine kinase
MEKLPWHILLIEDNVEDCADLRQMLLRAGSRRYRFSEARFGAEGVRKVFDPEHGPVDCVLLDYGLPDMDAPAVLAALCEGAEMPPCPVVVITGAAVEEGQALLVAGAQDFIGKRWTSTESLTRAVENAIDRYALQVEAHRAKNALRASEEHYRALYDSIDAGYVVFEMLFDEDDIVVDALCLQVNPAFAQQTGLIDAQGKTLRGMVPGIERLWLETYGAVALTGVPVRMEQYAQALQRWFDVYAFRLGASGGRQVAVLFTNTTERKGIESALVAAKSEADSANRAKTDFLLSMSHELRSPLSSMLGFTQLLEAGNPAPTPAQRDSIDQILHAGWYLLGLITEILDLSSIESGQMVLLTQAMSMREMLATCRAMVIPQAQGSGIEISFPSLDPDYLVQADPVRTKQVLLNLLTNAIKYNRVGGRVEVSCKVTPGNTVRVSVEDTGRGLSAAQMSQLFQPFNRLGQESGTKAGTGIGLMICKRLVELMGGTIGVESTVDVGSCFWFELDRVIPPTTDNINPPVRTVLCIDKDDVRRAHVEELVGRCADTYLMRAPDIGSGIEIARLARPDVILMSVQPPDPGGLDAVTRLAGDPATENIPVIALVEGVVPPGEQARLQASFFRYVSLRAPNDTFADALNLAFHMAPGITSRAVPLENT